VLISIKVFWRKVPIFLLFSILSILNPNAELTRFFEMLELSKYKVFGVFVTYKSTYVQYSRVHRSSQQ
jgi:hypothetical protein